MSNNSELSTEKEPLHLRLYVYGNMRAWLELKADDSEISLSKFVTKIVKAKAREEGVSNE